MSSIQLKRGASDKSLSPVEQQAKIDDVMKLFGPVADILPELCSEASILRFLKARNWSTKKASKMLKETLNWRLQYKPEAIQWEDIAQEAETGKIYRAIYCDKLGRPVLVMRPGLQNTNSPTGQIKYLVYCIENAIMNMALDQEQMVWLVDFQGWTMASISVKVTKETANILQEHYPERLGIGILYNPPKIFESFWTMVKPFLDPKTYKKMKFVYSDDPKSTTVVEEIFDLDILDVAFGGRNAAGFSYEEYAQQMKEDDIERNKYNKQVDGKIRSAFEFLNVHGLVVDMQAKRDHRSPYTRCDLVGRHANGSNSSVILLKSQQRWLCLPHTCLPHACSNEITIKVFYTSCGERMKLCMRHARQKRSPACSGEQASMQRGARRRTRSPNVHGDLPCRLACMATYKVARRAWRPMLGSCHAVGHPEGMATYGQHCAIRPI
ncbi:Sec14p-like phosphatidylinositol transfer family protein isoform 3 [Hibiscus syriacus]|uniref:Sec14p-like phosphatidylinositol transfer family protein isoform 3 n=1 Tax=Hibiscus syriacus TaxID=106335 RepID=A0A6A3AYJ4_HIBSY|nr:Sec14p-like phosphatidylinositol transfer family protein isoform 3 [Hibiscus syriacus]